MGFLLFLIASILWLPLTFLNWIAVAFKYGLSNSFFRSTAVDIDRFGNRNFRTLFNAVLIEPNGYQFGNVNETISSVLGKNQQTKTLSRIGKFLAYILDKIDKNHCINSIEKI